ncbi:hypothetical protein IFM89_003347 [Coptis chinensis]|uniref:Uncharacterized protein n=1 Tax=Coptis chinensis TaxID=261450 RepID=A0A835MBJ3_9MAGN|nr:hypothetical protein IFM89_003347 [Coptis chinensis]
MESSQLFGSTEKCSSSESGWTSYILSSSRHHNDHSDHKSVDVDHDGNGNYKRHDDSDDSLASDASSGPSQLENVYGNGEGVHFKHDEQESTSKYHSYKKSYKQKEKKTHELRRTKDEDDGDDYKGVLIASKVARPIQSGTKVRKNNRKSK